jgi:hypothetical protein
MSDPAPQPVLQSQTQRGFLSLQLITQACQAVANTVFVAPVPKPSWFDALQLNLDAAQAAANDWINHIAPTVTASVPQAVLDYGSTYQALSGQIVSICNANPMAKGATNPFVIQVQELIQALLDQAKQILDTIDATSTRLEAWGETLQTAHNNLATGAASIQNAEVALQTDVTNMNTAIASLNTTIAALNKELMDAQIAVGVGIFLGVVGLALAPVSGGASLLVGGIGVAAIIGGAVEWSKIQSQINSDFSQISADQQEKSADQAQIVALQGLSTASDQAVSNAALAKSSLSDFRSSWSGFHDDLTDVINNLTTADQELSTLLQEAFTNVALNDWNLAVAFATQLQQTSISVPTTQMDMDGNITGQAA